MRSLRYADMSIVALALVVAALRSATAAEPEEKFKVAILATAAEVTLTDTSGPYRRAGPRKPFEGQWIVRATDRSWEAQTKGAYDYTVSGFLWGGDRDNWEVTYSGRGYGANQPISVNGKAEWRYDQKLDDHVGMTLDNIVKFGENSAWGWIRGSEECVWAALWVEWAA